MIKIINDQSCSTFCKLEISAFAPWRHFWQQLGSYLQFHWIYYLKDLPQGSNHIWNWGSINSSCILFLIGVKYLVGNMSKSLISRFNRNSKHFISILFVTCRDKLFLSEKVCWNQMHYNSEPNLSITLCISSRESNNFCQYFSGTFFHFSLQSCVTFLIIL